MFRTCTIKLESQEGRYQKMVVNDMMKTVLFDSSIVEIDFAICLSFCKANYHSITIHKSVDEWLEENEDYRWQTTKYGEFITKVDCEKELIK